MSRVLPHLGRAARAPRQTTLRSAKVNGARRRSAGFGASSYLPSFPAPIAPSRSVAGTVSGGKANGRRSVPA